jgi:hypothetical protein
MTQPCTEKESIAVLKAYQADIRQDVKEIKTALLGDGDKNGIANRVSTHGKYFKMIAYFGGPLIVGLILRAVWAWVSK